MTVILSYTPSAVKAPDIRLMELWTFKLRVRGLEGCLAMGFQTLWISGTTSVVGNL